MQNEPPPNVVNGVWDLQYLPLALLVQPEGFPETQQLLPGDSEVARSTAGLVPILPVNSSTLRVTMPEAVDFGDGRGPVSHILLRRRNVPATPGLAVTGKHGSKTRVGRAQLSAKWWALPPLPTIAYSFFLDVCFRFLLRRHG
jgi:hypothetical protein